MILYRFYFVLHVAQITYEVAAIEISSLPAPCILLFKIQLAFNIPASDVDHYIVNIPSANVVIHKNSTLFPLTVPTWCSSNLYITTESVDRCGHVGPKIIIKPYLLPKGNVPVTKGTLIVYIPCFYWSLSSVRVLLLCDIHTGINASVYHIKVEI